MSLFASEIYEDLKTAYAVVLAGITDGSPVVKYTIRNRTVERTPTEMLLKTLFDQIQTCERQVNAAGTSIFRPVALGRVPRSDS